MTISPVSKSEHPRLVEVWEASVRASHHFLNEADVQVIKPLLEEVYLDAVELTAARDDAGAIVGFIGTAGRRIEMLFVSPEWFGKGTGRTLVEHAVEVLGADEVDVNEANERALGFYFHMGFVVFDRSERDGLGEPRPLLHMKLVRRDGPSA